MTIAVVQSAATAAQGVTSTSVSLSGVSSSNMLVLVVTTNVVPTTPSGFTLVYEPAAGGGAWNSEYFGNIVYIKSSPTAGTNTVSVSFSRTAIPNVCLIEVSGLTSSTADVKVVNNLTGTPTTVSVSSGSLAQANEIVFALLAYSIPGGVSNAAITNPPTGFTSLWVEDNTLNYAASEFAYQVVSATTSLSATWSWTDTTTAGAQGMMVSFKGAASVTTSNVCFVNCGC
jgi:hypothetical protein